MVRAETPKLSWSSSIFICSSKNIGINTHFTLYMSKENSTQQMGHWGESTCHWHSFFHPYHSHWALKNSSLTHKSQLSRDSPEKYSIPQLSPKSSTLLTKGIRHTGISALSTMLTPSPMPRNTSENNSQYNTPWPAAIAKIVTRPCLYPLGLMPNPSHLCPHCLAKGWLQSWHPFTTCADLKNPIDLSEDNFDHLLSMINYSWASSTQETYGADLLVNHVFCSMQNIIFDL